MKNEAIARYVTEEFLMENATSSSTSCHLIVAAENIANLIVEELRKANFDPTIIGSISKKGTPHVEIENNVNQYLALKDKMVRPNPIR
jgi:hydrogenase maturation factor HypE